MRLPTLLLKIQYKCTKIQLCLSLSVGATKLKELSPGEVQPADIPEGNDESPNDTGTAIKNPASREPTPQLRGQIKKRYVGTTYSAGNTCKLCYKVERHVSLQINISTGHTHAL